MRLPSDHWRLRLMGILFGIGCLAVGMLGILGEDAAAAGVEGTDAPAFAIIAIVTGSIAVAGSIITTDIIGFWYCNPKRLAARRAIEDRASYLSTDP